MPDVARAKEAHMTAGPTSLPSLSKIVHCTSTQVFASLSWSMLGRRLCLSFAASKTSFSARSGPAEVVEVGSSSASKGR